MKKTVIIVGAGPAGLGVAGSLIRRGITPRMLEKSARVGNSWHNHYERLHLHTVTSHSALPGLLFPEKTPKYASRQTVVDYLDSYAKYFGISPEFAQQVDAITPVANRWAVLTSRGDRYQADAVVVASGANCHPRPVAFPSQSLFKGEIIHSGSYRKALPYKGQRVLVVGMGNTGAEIALDLAEQGVDVCLSVRSPVNIVRRDVLGRPTQLSSIALSRLPAAAGDWLASLLRNATVGNLQRWGIETPDQSPLHQLREHGKTPVIDVGTIDRIKCGDITVHPGIAECTEHGVEFTSGQTGQFDAIVLATGYTAKINRLFPDAPIAVDQNHMPTEVIGTGSSTGLYFVGFDIRQPGGLLRTIARQSELVADALENKMV